MRSLEDIMKSHSILEQFPGCETLHTGTDKLVAHNYTVVYEELFENRRNDALNILEIGVAGGWSLKIWEEYFPNAMVYGVDIDEPNFEPEIGKSDRIDMRFFDGTDETLLHENYEDNFFDIIIDDGSHLINHQVLSAAFLWPKLRQGGIYIIEDTQNLRYDKYFSMYPNYKVFDCTSKEYVDKGNIEIGPGHTHNWVAWNSLLYTFRK